MAQSDSYVVKSNFTNAPQIKGLIRSIISCIITVILSFVFSFIPFLNILFLILIPFEIFLLILSIILCIITPILKKELFLLKDGIRIGKSFNNSIFIPWDKVVSIECPNLKSGDLLIKTSIPHKTKPQKTKRFGVESTNNYDIIEPTVATLMRSYKTNNNT